MLHPLPDLPPRPAPPKDGPPENGPRMRYLALFRAARPDDAAAMLAQLSVLKAIPHAQCLEVAINGRPDRLASEHHVVLHGEFAGPAALAAFRAHPLYAIVARRVMALRQERLAVDYPIPDAPDGPGAGWGFNAATTALPPVSAFG